MSAIDRLRVRLARVQVDPYVAKRGERIVPIIRHYRSLEIPGQLGLDFPKARKAAPTRRKRKESAIIAGETAPEMREAIDTGNARFLQIDHALGGGLNAPSKIPGLALAAMGPDEVTEPQRAESKRLIDKFMANPAMEPYFERFGRPTFVVAARTPKGDDPRHSKVEGEVGRTRAGAVMAAWRAGVITMYGTTVGDKDWMRDRKMPVRGAKTPKVSGGPFSLYRPEVGAVMDWAGRDAVLRHEYGHQVMMMAFDLNRPDGASEAFGGRGGEAVLDGLFRAVFDGRSREEVMSKITGTPDSPIPRDLNDAINDSLIPLSTYATIGGIQEAAAEAFAVVTDPRYKRETSPYPPATQRVLDFVEDLVK